MLKNYLLIAWRNLLRNRTFSLINIMGLAIGLTCFLLLALYVKDELSYDRHHVNADRIYRVSRTFLSKNGTPSLRLGHVAPPYGPLIEKAFPEIEQVVRMIENSALVRYGDSFFKEEYIYAAEPNVFKVFSFHVLSGNPEKALENPFSIMFSKPMAEKYFGKENPLGKTVRLDNQIDYTVTGVFEPLPAQSSFHPNFLLSFSTMNDERVYGAKELTTNFGNNSFLTFLLLPPNYDPQKLEKAFPAFQNKFVDPEASKYSILNLTKLTDIHLHSHLDSEPEVNSDIRYVYFFSAVAIFILIIACINYMNLTTARSAKRAREIGMRKVVGATRHQLIRQFLGESLLYTCIALLISIVLVAVCLPFLNGFSQKQIALKDLANPVFITILVTIPLLTAALSGSYPAFYLTSFQPTSVLKGKTIAALKSGKLRQVLVVVQFAIAAMLIISTIVVYSQMKYVQNYKLGYSKDQIVLLPAAGDSASYEAIREQIIQKGSIVDMARSSRIPTGRLLDSWGAYVMRGSQMTPTDITIKSLGVDEDFIPTYKIGMAAGRNFSRSHPTDRTEGFILNETAARQLGWKNPAEAIGNRFTYGDIRGGIIGVTKDYHFESLHERVAPIVMFMDSHNKRWWSVRIAGKDIKPALSHLETVWKSHFPDQPFSYEFLDERFGRLYAREQTQQLLFGIFAGIAIFISCLGLFGLSMFMAELRIKEIGIRKVMGASVGSIVKLLSSDFMKLVLIAFVIASPLAWWMMSRWLQDFAYRVTIQWWMFGLAGVLAIAIALLTISFQSVKAALMNPVRSLKSE